MTLRVCVKEVRMMSCLATSLWWQLMASRGQDRCGALCQHPGCWKSTKVVYSTPTDYMNKLERSKSLTPPQASRDCARSFTIDGLPTLKINTLECATVKKPLKPQLSPNVPARSRKTRPQVQSPRQVHYSQLFLEDDPLAKDMEIAYAPVLLWKPSRQKINAPSKGPSVFPKQSSQEFNRIPHSKEFRKRDPSNFRKNSNYIDMPRTDLTNALPPTQDSEKVKEADLERIKILQKLGLTSAGSLSCLKDVNLPVQVLNQILHQLRSDSSASLIDSPKKSDLPPIHHHNSHIQHNSLGEPDVPHISSHMHRTIYNFSPSRVFQAARRRSPRKSESFSRQLSIKPQETLQRFYAPIRKLTTGGENQISENNSDDIVLQLTDTSLAVVKNRTLLDLLPYSRLRGSEKCGPAVAPHVKKESSTVNPHIISNTSLDLNKKIGYRPAFKQRRIMPSTSDLDFSEESSVVDEAVTVLPKFPPVPRAPVNSCCESSLSSLPQSRATIGMLTPSSPDYMMMSAKLSSGKLVLTDRRKGRTTTVRKLTMSDSDINADSDFNLDHSFLPSPVQEVNDENSSMRFKPSGNGNAMESSSSDDNSDDVFENIKNDKLIPSITA